MASSGSLETRQTSKPKLIQVSDTSTASIKFGTGIRKRFDRLPPKISAPVISDVSSVKDRLERSDRETDRNNVRDECVRPDLPSTSDKKEVRRKSLSPVTPSSTDSDRGRRKSASPEVSGGSKSRLLKNNSSSSDSNDSKRKSSTPETPSSTKSSSFIMDSSNDIIFQSESVRSTQRKKCETSKMISKVPSDKTRNVRTESNEKQIKSKARKEVKAEFNSSVEFDMLDERKFSDNDSLLDLDSGLPSPGAHDKYINNVGEQSEQSNKNSHKKVTTNVDTAQIKKTFENERFNPFDRELVIEDDYYSSSSDQNSLLAAKVNGSSVSGSPVDLNFMNYDDDKVITYADFGLAEDHFSHPEGHFGLSSQEEMEMAISNCKEMILSAAQNSDHQRNLVQKLVQLRMKLLELKEGNDVTDQPNLKIVVGHRFNLQTSRSSKHYCEKCNALIWGMIQVWFRCRECNYCCHEKCLNQITRTCASLKVQENPTYILYICPERGLAYQNYRCAECRSPISWKSGENEPRICGYSGNFYCELCHWNDTMIIPARVVHNWDFEPRKVSRASKQYLRLMMKRAVLQIQDINPMLFSFVEELNEVRKLREEMLMMKKYFLSCQSARESRLLLQLQDRQHFVEGSDMYSLQDLIDIQSDTLLARIAPVHSSFAQHIKADCELCRAQGFICECCNDTQEILFPFDNIAVVCAQCSTVLHRHCFMKKGNVCPRCERRSKRMTQNCMEST